MSIRVHLNTTIYRKGTLLVNLSHIMITPNKLTAFVCMWAACDKLFPTPELSEVSHTSTRPPEVTTKTGHLVGYLTTSIKGRLASAYEGIPYAEPPVGYLRLRDPVPKGRWKGTLVADKRVKCIQMDPTRYYAVAGQEDCLYLNVYVPSSNTTKNENRLPVIVYIHGGSWHWGAGYINGPAYLMDDNVVLVTLNYRLGPLGFLSIVDEKTGRRTGNFGLKDQAMALQWIVDNIDNFGGNSKQITLMGHSAGGASVNFHMLSPLSRGKFQKAISLSGWTSAWWALPPNQTQLAQRFAASVGCFPQHNLALGKCLSRRSARRLVTKQYDLYELNELPTILFGPIVESNGPSAFLTESPARMYAKGQVARIPFMTGVTADEGEIFTFANYGVPLAVRRTVQDLDRSIPLLMGFGHNRTNSNTLTQKIKSFYFGGLPDLSYSGFEALKPLSQMIGDRYFYHPFDEILGLHLNLHSDPVYAYYFSFDGRHSVSEKFNFPASEWGVMHMDELQYLFNSSELYYPLKLRTDDYSISTQFRNMINKFAKTGVPTNQKWNPYESSTRQVLEINLSGSMIPQPYIHRLQFWKSLQKYL